MAAIRLRSPRYRDTVCTATHLSVKMVINISGSDVYTIIKDSVANQKNLFEYAELCRDYISINWTGSYSGWSPQAGLSIRTTITYHSGANATGSLVTTGVTGGGTSTEYGFDAYGLFMSAANDTINPGEPCFSNFYYPAGGSQTWEIYVPKNTSGNVAYLDDNEREIIYQSFGTSSTAIILGNNASNTVNIKRYDCSKYTVIPVDFVNSWGAIQREWFTLKNVKSLKAKREEFKRNIINSTGTYSVNKHTIQNFNITANEEITLNSDYLPEYYNEVFTDLLLSEQVWVNMTSPYSNIYSTIPVNITNSNITYKTQVNDRLINFTFSFKMSFNYINNVR